MLISVVNLHGRNFFLVNFKLSSLLGFVGTGEELPVVCYDLPGVEVVKWAVVGPDDRH